MSVGYVAFWVELPYLSKDWFQAEAWQLGLLGGSMSAGYVLTCLFVGRIARVMTRRQMITLGALITAYVSFAIGIAESMLYMTALVAVAGFGHGLFWPAIEAHLTAGVGPSELRHRVGWFNLSWSTGDVLGALMGGALYMGARAIADYAEIPRLLALPFLVTTGCCVAIVVIAHRSLRHAPESQSWRDEHDRHVPKSAARGGAAFLGVFWVMALIANSGATAFRGILLNVFPDIGKDMLGYNAFEWGVLVAMIPLTRTLMFIYWQRHQGWAYRARYLFGFQALLPLAAALSSPRPWPAPIRWSGIDVSA